MAKFDAKIDKSPEKWVVKLSGTIDEDADFAPLSLQGSGSIQLQLAGVTGINSCGIREWIKWMNSAGGVPVTWIHCPKVIVDQINMVEGFLPPTSKVQSFVVPYYNDDTGTEKDVLFTAGQEFSEGQVNPPATVQDESGNPMEMDVVESKYFKFIKK